MKIMMKLTQIARYIVMVAFVVMMLLTVVDVILRRFFSSPILGVTEYSQMVMVVILLAAACTAMEDSHIKVDILVRKFSPTAQNICELVTLTLSFFVSMLMASRAFQEGMNAIKSKLTFITVKVSKAPFFFLYGFGFFILCIAIIFLFVQAIKRLKDRAKGGEKVE